MIHFLAKFKYWIESDWVSFTTKWRWTGLRYTAALSWSTPRRWKKQGRRKRLVSNNCLYICLWFCMLMIISKASPEKEDAILASTGVFHLMALLLSILPYFTTCDRCSHFTATICSFVISMTTTMTIDRDNKCNWDKTNRQTRNTTTNNNNK